MCAGVIFALLSKQTSPLKSAFFCLLFLLLGPFSVQAQSGAWAKADSNLAETGVPFVIRLSVPKVAGGTPLKVDFSPWDSTLPPQNRLKQEDWHSKGERLESALTVLFFDADTFMLPPVSIALQGGGKTRTNPLEVVVLPTPAPDDLNFMADVKDIRKEPSHWTDQLPWVWGGLGVLGLLGLLFYLAQRKKKKTQRIHSQHLALPPNALALRRLEALTEKKLWQKGAVKAYYAELTDILRQYLEAQFQVPALESTSEEIIRQLQAHEQLREQALALSELLHNADLAKFAKGEPPETYHLKAWQEVRRFVMQG